MHCVQAHLKYFTVIDIEDLSSAGRLLTTGALPPVSEPGDPAEESGPQHSGQHSHKGTSLFTQRSTYSRTYTHSATSLLMPSCWLSHAGTPW